MDEQHNQRKYGIEILHTSTDSCSGSFEHLRKHKWFLVRAEVSLFLHGHLRRYMAILRNTQKFSELKFSANSIELILTNL